MLSTPTFPRRILLALCTAAVLLGGLFALITTIPALPVEAQEGAGCQPDVGPEPNPYATNPDSPEWFLYEFTHNYETYLNFQQQNVISECPGVSDFFTPAVLLTANPSSITQGASSTLTYASIYVESCSINQGVGTVSPNGTGTRVVSPSQTTTYTITCYDQYGFALTDSATVTVTAAPAPTATISANPATINQGQSTTLSWTSTNSTSCSINNGVGSVTPNTPGSRSVSPSVTTTYTITCNGTNGQQATAYTLVTVNATLSGSCSASPTSITTGQSSTWTASASGGTGSYTYSWSGTDSLSGSASSVQKTYSSSGTKTATVTITSGSQSASFSCSNSVSVGSPTPPTSCTVSTQNPTVGQAVTYTVNGGSAPYTWNPSGGTGSGTGSTRTQTYSVQGPYTMQVSGNGSSYINCPVVTAGPVSCGTASVSITASPNRVREGQTSTISWNASGVDSSCTISGPGVNQTVSGASCVIPNGSATPTITAQSVYTISCDSGEATAQAVVNLIPKFIEF